MGLTPHPRFAAPETEGICFADSAANASLLGREWAGQPPLELAQAHALARERAVAPRTWRDEGGCQRYMLAAGLDARLCASFALPAWTQTRGHAPPGVDGRAAAAAGYMFRTQQARPAPSVAGPRADTRRGSVSCGGCLFRRRAPARPAGLPRHFAC